MLALVLDPVLVLVSARPALELVLGLALESARRVLVLAMVVLVLEMVALSRLPHSKSQHNRCSQSIPCHRATH